MVSMRQLELNLELAFDEAAEVPEQANVLALWSEFEGELAGLPQREHLRVAGDILLQLSGLCKAKADLLWEDWQDAHNAEGPVMAGDWLQGLTRQTQELDFSDLVKRSYHIGHRSLDEAQAEVDSVLGAVDKGAVLEMLDGLDADDLKHQALSVSHAEHVSAWVQALSESQTGTPQRLVDLQHRLQRPLVEVWLAALLGGFVLEQRGGFYDTDAVWIGVRQGG